MDRGSRRGGQERCVLAGDGSVGAPGLSQGAIQNLPDDSEQLQPGWKQAHPWCCIFSEDLPEPRDGLDWWVSASLRTQGLP